MGDEGLTLSVWRKSYTDAIYAEGKLLVFVSKGSTLVSINLQSLDEFGDRAQAAAFHSHDLGEALLQPQARHRSLQNVNVGELHGVSRWIQALEPGLER